MSAGSILLAAALAYLLGGVPFGFLLVSWTTGRDIRTMGSGNIGATNVHRTVGRTAGLVVLALDIAKGFSAVWLANLLTHGSPMGLAAAALAVMLGHAFPLFLGLRGGKAVASFIGAFLFIAPLALACVLAVFVLVVAVTKYVSLGSVLAALLFPLAVWLLQRPPGPILAASLFAGLLIAYRHKANLIRLRNGTEHVFSLRGGKA